VVVLEKGRYTKAADLSLKEREAVDSMYESGSLMTTEDAGAGSGRRPAAEPVAAARRPPHATLTPCYQGHRSGNRPGFLFIPVRRIRCMSCVHACASWAPARTRCCARPARPHARTVDEGAPCHVAACRRHELRARAAGVSILAGATLGGGTRINWQASFRTPAHVRREWAAEHGLTAFESPRYDRALDAVWQRCGVTTGARLPATRTHSSAPACRARCSLRNWLLGSGATWCRAPPRAQLAPVRSACAASGLARARLHSAAARLRRRGSGGRARRARAGILEHSKQNEVLKEGLQALGVHCSEIPRNCSPGHTCGHCCFGCPTGDKQDATATFLPDAVAAGARILTGARARPAPHARPLRMCRNVFG